MGKSIKEHSHVLVSCSYLFAFFYIPTPSKVCHGYLSEFHVKPVGKFLLILMFGFMYWYLLVMLPLL